MYYKTHELEQLHQNESIILSDDMLTYTVYDANFNIVAVYEKTFTPNMVCNGIHRIA